MTSIGDIEDRLLDSAGLPSLPHVAVRIIHLSRDPDTTLEAIAQCLSTDPAQVQKILRMVNSPYYGLRRKVSTVSKAAAFLGINAVRGLVLGFSLPRDDPGESGSGFSMVTFWRYSLTNAVAARLLAPLAGYPNPEEAFVAGLLADVGVLVLHRAAPQDYARVLKRRWARLREIPPGADASSVATVLCQAEQEILGTDHARISGRLCAQWRLPDILTIPVRLHHAPAEHNGQPGPVVELTRLVNLAVLVGQAFNIGHKRRSLDALEQLARDDFNLDRRALAAVLRKVAADVRQVADLFQVDVGQPLSYEEILEQANAELAKLTVAAHRDVERETRQKVEVERRARQLESLNVQLAERANRDALTGVFNRGFFDRFLTEAFESGRAANRSMGLIIVDVHRFKRINDTWGHPQGDAVIVELAGRLQANTRDCDMVARYGGDEFAIVLPDADLAVVQCVASRLRGAVWDQPFALHTGGTLDVSMGIGAVCVCDYTRVRTEHDILAAADRLLYATKQTRDRKIRLLRI